MAPEATQHILNQTSLYLRGRAEFAKAKAQYERALTLAEKAYGRDHLSIAIRVNNLGSVLHDLDDLQAAKEYYERALAIFQRFLGEDHPTTATVRDNLRLLVDV